MLFVANNYKEDLVHAGFLETFLTDMVDFSMNN